MVKIKKREGEKGKKLFIIWIAVCAVFLVGSYAAFMEIKSRPPKKVGAYGHMPLQNNIPEVVDPVCGMEVKPPAAGHTVHKEKTYYFCGTACKEDFEKEPQKYIHRRNTENAKKMGMKEMQR